MTLELLKTSDLTKLSADQLDSAVELLDDELHSGIDPTSGYYNKLMDLSDEVHDEIDTRN